MRGNMILKITKQNKIPFIETSEHLDKHLIDYF